MTKLNSFLGCYYRAKLGHGLLSGEYSKPAMESGDGEQVPEQKVSLGFYPFQTVEFYRETKSWEVSKLGQWVATESLPWLCLGSSRWHCPSNVQGPHWQGPPGVLHESAAGCPGILPSPYQHGGGKDGKMAERLVLVLLFAFSWSHLPPLLTPSLVSQQSVCS